MKVVRCSAFLLVLAALVLLNVKPAEAQAGVEMDLYASHQFGEHITFTARLISPVQIQRASIFIHDSTQVITHVQPVTFNEGGVSEFRFDTRQNLLRPFTTVQWRYELTLADGSLRQSETGSVRYDDDRFEWQTLPADPLRIHWYQGDKEFGVSALNAAQGGIQNIRRIFEPDLSQPVDIYIYASESDLSGTLYGSQAWAAGHADSEAGVVMVTIEPGADQGIRMEQRIPHELMHVLFSRQVGAGYREVPAWLREGMAVLAEVYPDPNTILLLRDAAVRDQLIPIRDLCDSFSPRFDSALLAYAEARSFTDYLRGLYGSDGLLNLAKVYASGVDCERGPERAFGVSLAKLERDWRVTALGQTGIMSTLGNFAPYLLFLCLVMLFPLIGVIGSLRKKGNLNGR